MTLRPIGARSTSETQPANPPPSPSQAAPVAGSDAVAARSDFDAVPRRPAAQAQAQAQSAAPSPVLPSLDLGTPGAPDPGGIGPFPPHEESHGSERFEKTATPNAEIPDLGTVTSTIDFDEPFDVDNVKLNLDIAHTYRGDLVVKLTSPSGKTAILSNREGGSADDIKQSFDLSQFAGEPMKGQWTLTVEDQARLDSGTLRSWTLSIASKSDPEPAHSVEMPVLGQGQITNRYTSELTSRNGFVYSSTWGSRGGNAGNQVNVWDMRGDKPQLVNTLTIPGAGTTGDVSISEDGKTMMVSTNKGSIVNYDLSDPANPVKVSEFSSPDTRPEVHTGKLATVNGKTYAFLSSIFSSPPKVVVVDLSNPAEPKQVKALETGSPYQHDVWVKDGMLYTAGWDEGMTIWDIGGGGRGGSPENPVALSTIATKGGAVHNIGTTEDPVSGKKFALIGEEHPGTVGRSSAGDIHVVDITDPTQPKEVGFYHVDGAGTHNFAIDAERGILYAAYYNAGVRAIDIRGDLSQGEKAADGRVDLGKSGRELGHALGKQNGDNYVWGVTLMDGMLYASDMLNGVFKLDPSVIKLPDVPGGHVPEDTPPAEG
ncbi:MAG TPA: proprotein convertase P-domain-containing protein [Gemmatimonadales bacterium]|nr:proprotein convertase P-domain-containing protein [Gemmatimonadales bacterium]